MQYQNFQLRRIQEKDNATLATIIRTTLEEFGANHPGTVYFDKETDHMFKIFEQPGSWYFVAERNNEIWGGAGIFPTPGLPFGTCELVKMYLLPAARGTGLGNFMLQQCMQKARDLGYQFMYLETMPELTAAVPMYEKNGFQYLDKPMGNSGHFGCAIQMLRAL